MKQLLVSIIILTTLVGCASTDKPTIPKGKWHLVNQTGFVPANVMRYTAGGDVYIDEEVKEEVQEELKNGAI